MPRSPRRRLTAIAGKKPMREFSSLTPRDVAEELKRPCDTLITCHVKPDGDCLGSAFALKAILEALGSRAWVVCAEECPNRLAFLLDGEQKSILPLSVPQDLAASRIIAVDTASPMQAGALMDLYGDRYTLMIDHHGRGTPFTDHWVLPEASATGEMIFTLSRLLVSDGALRTVPQKAEAGMYAAISSDTGCFRFSNATPETHRTAAELLLSGIDAAEINRRLFSSVSYLQMQAEHEGFSRLQLFENGRIAAITFPYEIKQRLGLRDEHTETLIDVARMIEGVDIAFVLKQADEAPLFRLSMRSAIDFDVSEVCATFGGGGHVRAAGATIEGAADIDIALERVLSALRERL